MDAQAGADAVTLQLITTQMQSLSIAVTPFVAVTTAAARALIGSSAATQKFSSALAREARLPIP